MAISETRKLTLEDISDLREYERGRDDSIAAIIALKKRRRPHVGPFISLLFDNRETVLSQIHEMARAERILTDEGLQIQLDTYNPLIPEPGTLSATLLLELTEDPQLREWLPRLVGIERHVVIDTGGAEVRCMVDEDHQEQLTREDVTAAVHFIRFEFLPPRSPRGARVRQCCGSTTLNTATRPCWPPRSCRNWPETSAPAESVTRAPLCGRFTAEFAGCGGRRPADATAL